MLLIAPSLPWAERGRWTCPPGPRTLAESAARPGTVAVRVKIHTETSVGKILMIYCKETTFICMSVTLPAFAAELAHGRDGLRLQTCNQDRLQPVSSKDIS